MLGIDGVKATRYDDRQEEATCGKTHRVKVVRQDA